MQAIIRVDVPDYQIGQQVTVYFKDTMQKHGVCEANPVVQCADCKHYHPGFNCDLLQKPFDKSADIWYCADGEQKEVL